MYTEIRVPTGTLVLPPIMEDRIVPYTPPESMIAPTFVVVLLPTFTVR